MVSIEISILFWLVGCERWYGCYGIKGFPHSPLWHGQSDNKKELWHREHKWYQRTTVQHVGTMLYIPDFWHMILLHYSSISKVFPAIFCSSQCLRSANKFYLINFYAVWNIKFCLIVATACLIANIQWIEKIIALNAHYIVLVIL